MFFLCLFLCFLTTLRKGNDMNNIDFSECEFIDDNLKFYTYYDFFENRKAIKKLYNKLSRNGKLFYMWYVYSNVHMDERYKNATWDYLNDYESDEKMIEILKKYKVK